MKRAAFNSFPNEPENVKKSRQGRRNDRQLAYMVDYMVQNPHVATGKFHSLNGRNDLAGSWEDLITSLNNLRNPGVKEKDIKSWKESWRDLKTKVSKKSSALRNAKKKTGNKSIGLDELTEIEKKVLGLVGYDYIEGTECPDSWPEELHDDVERLAAGDRTILDIAPTPLTLRSNNGSDINGTNNSQSLEITEDSTQKISEKLSPSVVTNQPMSPIYITVPYTQSISSFSSEPSFNQLSTNQPTESNIPSHSVKKKNVNKDVKLKTQFNHAREMFTNLAKSNNQQLELLTSTLSMVAESNLQMAAAVTKISENDEKRLILEEKRLLHEEKYLNVLSTIISKLN